MLHSSSGFPNVGELTEIHFVGHDSTPKHTSHLDFPFLLDDHGIAMGGHTVARKGNMFSRLAPSFTQILVSRSGMAHALENDRWVPLFPGTAYITPINQRHAYFAATHNEWEFSWIIYPEFGPKNIAPFIQKDQPYTIQVDPDLLSFPLLGLYNESVHQQDEHTMQTWAQLANTYVRRALAGDELDPRLRKLWLKVKEDLSHPWSGEQMAKIANMSGEHLRRLCVQTYSQSPMQRLRSLRMRHASELLAYSDVGIEQIAEDVGYTDAAALSRAFKKSKQISPAKYRKQARKMSQSSGQ